jgi:cytochrome c oxidase assembly factor CtaG
MIPLTADVVAAPNPWTTWEWDPWIVAPLAVCGALYSSGIARLWRTRAGRAIRKWEAACFASGWIVLLVALCSPVHELSESLFAAHMVQHELLMAVAAPLLVLGRPLVPTLWALPPRARIMAARATRSRAWRNFWHLASRPADAWVLHAAAIWAWHMPVLFQLALRSDFAHAIQHACFLGSGLLFWWALIHGRGARIGRGASVLYVFTTAMHTGLLGAMMTIARTPWYPAYAPREAALGMSPLQDQQLAGLIMWIPASIPYLIAALLLLAAWMRDSERTVALAEAPGLPFSPGGRSPDS